MAAKKLSEFIVKSTLKEMQQRKTYKTLDELRADLEKEFAADGYKLDEDEKYKIRQLVDEEGYTGRFAIDDILLRKIKNRKYWPIVSVCAALLIFVLSSAAGAIIEYFVQKPLADKKNSTSTPVIAAYFQLPKRVYGGNLDFTVKLQNQLGDESLKDLVLFVSAEDKVKKIDIEFLSPGEEKVLNGSLNVHGVQKKEIMFNAYIIGAKVSFKSEPIAIENAGSEVAVVSPTRRDVAMEMDSDAGVLPPSAVKDEIKPGALAVADCKNENADPPQEQKMPVKTINADKNRVVEKLEVNFQEMESDLLAGELITGLQGLSMEDPEFKSSFQILEVLARAGNEKAQRFIGGNI